MMSLNIDVSQSLCVLVNYRRNVEVRSETIGVCRRWKQEHRGKSMYNEERCKDDGS